MKRTSLHQKHVQAGAKIVPFAGWEMPVHYGSILDEVRTVRSRVGLFDVSHMGEVLLSGPGALAAVQTLFTNDASRLTPGRAQYTLMCRPDGGILDDLIVYRVDSGSSPEFLIVVNAANRASDFEWMTHHAGRDDIQWEDRSDHLALLALQGPASVQALQSCGLDFDFASLRTFGHRTGELSLSSGPVEIRMARTGYTGEDGFEIFCPWFEASALWDLLVEKGALPCGLGARDVLRIEASYPLYGHEISTDTNPIEAGLGWVVKEQKGDFIGRSAIVEARTSGTGRRLAGIIPEDERAIPREGMTVHIPEQQDGRITSGTYSPTMNRAIAMAYVPVGSVESATIPMRGREMPAHVVPLPFYKRSKT